MTLDRRPLRLLITQTGRDKRRLEVADLVRVAEDGAPVAGDPGQPSAETLLHCTIVEKTGAGSTLHTHSVASTLLSEHFLADGGLTLAGYEMLKGLEGVRSHEARVFIPVLANAQDMSRFSRRVAALLDERPGLHGFLIAGHGLYTWGADLAQARRHLEIFEFLLECVARRTGFHPVG